MDMALDVFHHDDRVVHHQPDSTMASSVNKLMVRAGHDIRKTAPTREIGMATTGMSTERNDPRKRKMTMMTMTKVSVECSAPRRLRPEYKR